MNNKNVYISDQFETWQTCRKKYYYKYKKRLKLPEPQVNFNLGKSVHAMAYYHLQGLDIEHLEEALDEETRLHWNCIKNHSIISNELVVAEWEFNTRIPDTNYWLIGRIDAVFYNKEKKEYIIVDWKTGQNVPKDPETGFQSKIYLYSFFNAKNDLKISLKHEDLAFQYIKTPDNDEIPLITYSKEKEKSLDEFFKNTIHEIETTDNFPKKTETYEKSCKYCPYKVLCF